MLMGQELPTISLYMVLKWYISTLYGTKISDKLCIDLYDLYNIKYSIEYLFLVLMADFLTQWFLVHLCRQVRSTFAVRETQSLGQQMLNAPVDINGLTWVRLSRNSSMSQFQGFGDKRFWAIKSKIYKIFRHTYYFCNYEGFDECMYWTCGV